MIYDILIRKRNGLENSREELEELIGGFVKDKVPDYQMAAWLMAVYFRHLSARERADLTEIMLHTGDIIDLSDINGTKIDKHSTGGVGDKVTLIVGPMVASEGVVFAKLSGRGLGHTGGTVDKLESIPGFRTDLSLDHFKEQANRIGIALAGQTGNIVPADKKIYALRDVTTTVDEVSLIASSIMSKKLAITTDGIVLDVKVGTGAFMKNIREAEELSKAMIDIGKRHGRSVSVVISDMNQPLGMTVGNALEVREAIETLSGHGPEDLEQLCICLAAKMLELAGVGSEEHCVNVARKTIETGSGLEKLIELVRAQGGDPKSVTPPTMNLPRAQFVREIFSEAEGYIESIDAEAVGLSSMILGAGRRSKDDKVDPAAGVEITKKIGNKVERGEVIAVLHTNLEDNIEPATRKLLAAYTFSDDMPEVPALIKSVL
ncbi:MAG TPA: thymidine phosphorylase [Kosmotogaceae bacterium]|nr:MAG: Pyrimidine-nucleoside phosphorylase [Thermotogales bacterium 46_20]HAA85986.1 thymidine phosphorylase [Kosmotogaceae bacterium]